jgi:hypothetical protein
MTSEALLWRERCRDLRVKPKSRNPGHSVQIMTFTDQASTDAFGRAIELAATGHYSGWRAIETALRQFRPAIRGALSAVEAQKLIDGICREHWRTRCSSQ